MAKINHRFKACHIEATKEEWIALRTIMHSGEYTFPEYFMLETNYEKLLPEYIIDLVELKDLLHRPFDDDCTDYTRHLTAVADCLNIDINELAKYGILQLYYEEE